MANHRANPRLLRLLLLAAIAVAGTAVGYFALLPPDRSFSDRFTMSTAYVGLFFLAAALIIGPLNVLRGVSNPLSTYLRRDIGIIAGILAIAHTIIGLFVHLGDPVQYFFYRTPTGIDGVRLDAFGIANHIGLIATVIILILLCISNNASIRRLGPEWWKRIQRWNYVAAIAVILHALLYQVVEEQKVAFIASVLIVVAGVMVLQLLGFWRRRERLRAKPPKSGST
jgi:sulfoxide reductase heme-binding subunit YedZ